MKKHFLVAELHSRQAQFSVFSAEPPTKAAQTVFHNRPSYFSSEDSLVIWNQNTWFFDHQIDFISHFPCAFTDLGSNGSPVYLVLFVNAVINSWNPLVQLNKVVTLVIVHILVYKHPLLRLAMKRYLRKFTMVVMFFGMVCDAMLKKILTCRVVRSCTVGIIHYDNHICTVGQGMIKAKHHTYSTIPQLWYVLTQQRK